MNRTINYGCESVQNFTELEINEYILYRDIIYRNVYVLYIQYVYTLQVRISTSGTVVHYKTRLPIPKPAGYTPFEMGNFVFDLRDYFKNLTVT